MMRRFTTWLGSLPLLTITWGLAGALSLWAVADLMVLKVSSGLANSTYDAMVRARFHAPPHDPRIVIVDIDESSLQVMAKEFGRWPWPRDTLATVLDHIESQQPLSIAWDIIFSDADRLSPGGDKAFDDAAKRSVRSHFSVVRLPAEYDAQSQLTADKLPGLWLSQDAATLGRPTLATPPLLPAANPAIQASTLAVIPPILPAVAAGKLGYNNGYTDSDGVLRRYRYVEALDDGSHIQSLALAVARSLHTITPKLGANYDYSTRTYGRFDSKKDDLMVWRTRANSYPRISFAQVFAQAEGAKLAAPISLQGKIVLIGATASSLHDIHPTPLSSKQAGIDSLATAMDNAINGHHLAELPAALQALLAVLLVCGMAAWALKRGLAALEPALLLLPAALLAVSYLSLNVGSLFIDLHLAAGVALLFIALLKLCNGWRRNHWCSLPEAGIEDLGLMRVDAHEPITDAKLDRLIRRLELHAPQCRIIGGDASAVWPSTLRWPSLLHGICITGPVVQLAQLREVLVALQFQCGEPAPAEHSTTSLTLQAHQLLASTSPIFPPRSS
jgi:adenylate cyclase